VAAEAVTALGDSLDESWRALRAGRCGVARVGRFDTGGYISDYAAHCGWVDRAAADAADADRTRTRAGGASLVSALLAPLLAKIDVDFYLPADALLFTATTKAGIDVLEKKLRGAAANEEELLFSHWLAYLQKRLGLTDGGVNVSAACASSTVALARAGGAIAAGRAEVALVVGFDVITEFVFSGFSALRALSPAPATPFDRGRTGLTLGDGAAALLVMSGARARREGRRSLAQFSGWGIANDATHVTAPARDGSGLIAATRAALERAQCAPQEVGALFAHGTGTVYNDAMELTAFGEVFGGKEDNPPPLLGVKGALGHTMGAAGAIEAALSLKMLEERVVPATVGLADPEERGLGWVTTGERELERPKILTTNSGFGGVNGALLLERVEDALLQKRAQGVLSQESTQDALCGESSK
jgi:3-oxoacyl-[acyl-carrier-protein] synthase II